MSSIREDVHGHQQMLESHHDLHKSGLENEDNSIILQYLNEGVENEIVPVNLPIQQSVGIPTLQQHHVVDNDSDSEDDNIHPTNYAIHPSAYGGYPQQYVHQGALTASNLQLLNNSVLPSQQHMAIQHMTDREHQQQLLHQQHQYAQYQYQQQLTQLQAQHQANAVAQQLAAHQQHHANQVHQKAARTHLTTSGGGNGADNSPFYSKGRLKWTPEMDSFLKAGVEAHKEHGVGMWQKVAEYVCMRMGVPHKPDEHNFLTVCNAQCSERYKHHLDPSVLGKKTGPWSQAEVDELRRLVAEAQQHAHDRTSKRNATINWSNIGNKLNRNYRDCQHKHTNLVKADLKQGEFTKEEEAELLRRVEEWGDKGKGIWVALEKEMNRRNRSLQDKYNRLIKRKVN